MLEAIRMLGVLVFGLSAPLAFAIGVYETYHPEYLEKIRKIFERHSRIGTIFIVIYVLLAEVGILLTIAQLNK